MSGHTLLSLGRASLLPLLAALLVAGSLPARAEGDTIAKRLWVATGAKGVTVDRFREMREDCAYAPAPVVTVLQHPAFSKASVKSAKAAGKTPRVLLLKRGDLKMKMARAAFCLNFFGCGGFDIVESEELDPAADLIVLCSSDPEYVEFARDIVSKTKTPIVVAGNPKESIEELKAIGVAGFVHVLSNQIDTLREWQDRLEVRS